MMPFLHGVEGFLNPDRIIAILGVIIALVAAVAAIYAAVYAKAAPTKEDFKRLEDHAAATSGHLEKVHTNISRMDERLYEQHERDSLISTAQSISITVQGIGGAGEGLPIEIRLKDPDIPILRLELYNEDGVLFGAVACSKVQPLVYRATLDWDLTVRWFSGGGPSYARKLLQLRVYMTLREKEVYRQLPIYMKQESRNVDNRPNVFGTFFVVDGNV